ncbi:MAG: FecR domain-containing protein [Elusimicrobia bacterium]|nr:FecR domain-containing protein [Elusimicrobiota bacterium]
MEGPAAKGPAKEGQALSSGDWIETLKAATAVIELADGSALKLKELSRFQLELPAGKERTTSGLLSFGGVFAKVAKVLPGASFEIRTETAVAAVRGTEFFTAFGRAKKAGRDLWVCVNKGAVDVTTTASKAPLRVPAGKGILIKAGLDLTKPQAYEWTKKLNWNMDPKSGALEDQTNLDSAYTDLLDQDYR